MSREIDFRTLVLLADPNHTKTSRRVAEYEFSAPSRAPLLASHGDSNDDDTEFVSRDVRVFYGNYQTKGAFAPQPDTHNGIRWAGKQLTWNGVPLTWDDD